MTRQSHLEFCTVCVNQQKDLNLGIICALNGQTADFEINCDSFHEDSSLKARTSGNRGAKVINGQMAAQVQRFVNYLINLFV